MSEWSQPEITNWRDWFDSEADKILLLRGDISPNTYRARKAMRTDIGSGDFSIGSIFWAGIGKAVEEMGELLQVMGKLIGSRGKVHHWDGSNLKERLEEEIGDVRAALRFVVKRNGLDEHDIAARIMEKSKRFNEWHAAELPMPLRFNVSVSDHQGDRRWNVWDRSKNRLIFGFGFIDQHVASSVCRELNKATVAS